MHGFTEKRTVKLNEIGTVLHEMEHDKTGAKLCWLERPDENMTFGIAFTTLPYDNTGVFHILEHSVFCGSEKYPVKEPFLDLLKSSMNTFLNAMTFPDKTLYPVSSKNKKDFVNLMRVYLDAVFHPAIYTKPEIFAQEGWHYDFDEEGNVSYKGVVFNEMKGAFASPDELLKEEMTTALFPDNCYGYCSGGDPAEIPDLSYEAFLEAHKKHYAPSNSFIYLDGNVDIDEVLSIIDGEYLADFEKTEAIGPANPQAPVEGGLLNVEYEIGPDESPENRYHRAWGYVACTKEEREKFIALNVLSEVLCGNNQSPLVSCILEKQLAEDVIMALESDCLQPWVLLEVQNFREENMDEVVATIEGKLAELRKGLNHAQIMASLANLEFFLRECDYGSMPKGLVYCFEVLDSWQYGGKPETNLVIGELFENLRAKVEEGYFEDLIEEVFLTNNHKCQAIMTPSHTAGEKRREAEAMRIEKECAEWTGEQRQAYADFNKGVMEWQMSEDSEEAAATLPTLDISDISTEPEFVPSIVNEIDGVTMVKHDVPCGGIVYPTLYFDIDDLSDEELPVASMLCSLYGVMPTSKHTADEVMTNTQLLCGYFDCNIKVFPRGANGVNSKIVFMSGYSTLEKNQGAALDHVMEILTDTLIEDEMYVQDILRQDRMSLMEQIVMDGTNTAANRVASQVNGGSALNDMTNGYEFYKWLKEQDENWNWSKLQKEMKDVAEKIICKARLTVTVTGSEGADETAIAKSIAADMTQGEKGERREFKPWGKKMEGIAVPSDVSFAVKGGSLVEAGGKYTPDQSIAAHIIGLDYLWNVIRVQGGAYGAGLMTRKTGFVACYSYRDPSPERSLALYDDGPVILAEACAQDIDLTPYIIGAIAKECPVLTPRMMGLLGDQDYFAELTYEDLKKRREALLSVTPERLKAACELLGETIKAGGVCVIGPEEELKACGLEILHI